MGNQKFNLSDMIPNAWFYKLKDMSKPSKTTQTKLKKHNRLPPPPAPPSSPPSTTNPPPQSKPEPQCQPRKSYHFTRELYVSSPLEDPPLTPPRKSKSSSKSRKSTRKSTNNNNGCNCRTTATLQSHRPKTASTMGETNVIDVGFSPEAENVSPLQKAEHFDIVIDVDNYKYRVPSSQLGSAQLLESLSAQSYKINGFDFHLPRIITKPSRSPKSENSTKELDTEKLPMVPLAPSSRRFSVSSPAGVRLKINSPKIMARKQGQNGNFGGRKSAKKRRSISESFAVVKSSDDPQRDFKESMVEMILQNNLRASKDLEDLLACYLSLNSDEYHDVIIKVFKQIWFDLSDLKHKKFVP